ncbi:SLC5/6 family protein [Legionella clemsonensis]|uniref:Sodium/panthothenate symporter n=1 Tax=Legionella clemsonensis TaxID=1867846 RepID=A0A222P4S6_9GAMM|nr:hypothetical protein [Legionella clemsonensis]ASQ46860.1 hypothetical protein clem_11615 [Legionella clemsonensis]
MINLITAVLFLFAFVYISQAKKANTQIEYVTAGKKTKLLPLIATLVMTEINPMALIAMSALGYMAGYWALSMAFIAFLAPLLASLTTSKKWKNFNSTCISTLFDRYLGYTIGNIVRFILIISLIILNATYVKGIIIFSKIILPELSIYISISTILLFCIFSVLKKGLSGIIRMDIIGFVLTVIFLLICLIFSYYYSHLTFSENEIRHFNDLRVLPVKYLIAIFFLQLIMYSIAPWWGQKIFSANSTKTAYKATIYSAFILFILYSSIILSAIYLKEYGVILKDSDFAFPMIITTFTPTEFTSFYVLTFFYIATTTICGVWSAMSGMITSGFLRKNNEESPKLNYIIWVILGAITYYIAMNNIDSVLHAAVLAVMQICSIYFSVIAIFYFERISKSGSLISIFLSIFIGYTSYILLGEEGNYLWFWVIIGIPTMFISGYIASGFSNVFSSEIIKKI